MSEHKFRYLLAPGTNFQFVAKFKTWIWLSIFLTAATVGILLVNKSVRGEYMHWHIDFRGGTEMFLAFKDRKTHEFVAPDISKARESLAAVGEDAEISEVSWTDDTGDKEVQVQGLVVRTPRFSALLP